MVLPLAPCCLQNTSCLPSLSKPLSGCPTSIQALSWPCPGQFTVLVNLLQHLRFSNKHWCAISYADCCGGRNLPRRLPHPPTNLSLPFSSDNCKIKVRLLIYNIFLPADQYFNSGFLCLIYHLHHSLYFWYWMLRCLWVGANTLYGLWLGLHRMMKVE